MKEINIKDLEKYYGEEIIYSYEGEQIKVKVTKSFGHAYLLVLKDRKMIASVINGQLIPFGKLFEQ